MSEKTKTPLLGRICHKHDTSANWSSATGFSPLPGELIIYDADSTHDFPRFKVGDGNTNVNDLPFMSNTLIVNVPTRADGNMWADCTASAIYNHMQKGGTAILHIDDGTINTYVPITHSNSSDEVYASWISYDESVIQVYTIHSDGCVTSYDKSFADVRWAQYGVSFARDIDFEAHLLHRVAHLSFADGDDQPAAGIESDYSTSCDDGTSIANIKFTGTAGELVRLHNVAEGEDEHDVATVGQLNSSLTSKANSSHTHILSEITDSPISKGTGEDSLVIGEGSAVGKHSIALGTKTKAVGAASLGQGGTIFRVGAERIKTSDGKYYVISSDCELAEDNKETNNYEVITKTELEGAVRYEVIETSDGSFVPASDLRVNESVGSASMAAGMGAVAYSRASKSLGYRTQTGYPPEARYLEERPEDIILSIDTARVYSYSPPTSDGTSTVEFSEGKITVPSDNVGDFLPGDGYVIYGGGPEVADFRGSNAHIEFNYHINSGSPSLPGESLEESYTVELITWVNDSNETVQNSVVLSSEDINKTYSADIPVPSDTNGIKIKVSSKVNSMSDERSLYITDLTITGFPEDNVGQAAVATGSDNIAVGNNSFAGGYRSIAIGDGSLAYGTGVKAYGNRSIALGGTEGLGPNDSKSIWTEATGFASIAIGSGSKSKGTRSIALGHQVIANAVNQVVLGRYNVEDTSSSFILGNGTSETKRSNALVITKDGTAKFSADVVDGHNNSLNTLRESIRSIEDKVYDEHVQNRYAVNTFYDQTVDYGFDRLIVPNIPESSNIFVSAHRKYNLIPINVFSTKSTSTLGGGVQLVTLGDGFITADGKATGDGVRSFTPSAANTQAGILYLPAGSYVISGCQLVYRYISTNETLTSLAYYYAFPRKDDKSNCPNVSGDVGNWTIQKEYVVTFSRPFVVLGIKFYVKTGSTFNNNSFAPYFYRLTSDDDKGIIRLDPTSGKIYINDAECSVEEFYSPSYIKTNISTQGEVNSAVLDNCASDINPVTYISVCNNITDGSSIDDYAPCGTAYKTNELSVKTAKNRTTTPYIGTTEPPSQLGVDGDIYIMYE